MYCALLTALSVATRPVGHDPGGDVAGLAPRGRVALLLVGRLLGPAAPVSLRTSGSISIRDLICDVNLHSVWFITAG